MNAVALDPGVTTGYAMGLIEDTVMTVVTGQNKWNESELLTFLHDLRPDYIICERFEFRHGIHRHHGANMFSRQLIGIVNLYSQFDKGTHDHNCVVLMQPAMKDNETTFFNNKRLKSMGLYKAGRDHANDAVRHLLYWAKFKSGSQFVKTFKIGVLE